MLGGLVTLADSKNTSLGMTIAFKLEEECLGGCGGGRGSIVRALAAKSRGPAWV